jgi:hypothetical protein
MFANILARRALVGLTQGQNQTSPNVRSMERALLDRWEDDAGEKAWRSTARVTGRALSGRCAAAPCHVCAVAPSKRPSGKTNRVSHV